MQSTCACTIDHLTIPKETAHFLVLNDT